MTARDGGKGDKALNVLLQAGKAPGLEEFLFVVVNRSVAVANYDRASVWDVRRGAVPLAVSGGVAVNAAAPFASMWSGAIAGMADRKLTGVLGAGRFSDPGVHAAIAEKTGGLAALWAYVPEQRVGVLFERWGSATFSDGEAAELLRLVEGYGLLWKNIGRRSRPGRRGWKLPVAVLAVVLLLTFVKVPLRVVAPCEVTARRPHLISAPLDGVIDSVLVAPGQRVEVGDVLALYDSRLMEDELRISRRQAEVVEAELASARARAFSDPRYRGETTILEARLEQERARLDALETRFARRTVTSPVAGMVQLDNARAWRGRPVSTGQAILWLVDPEDTRVSLWLPQDDRIDFDPARPIRVHLHALGGEAREAGLTYVSSFAQSSPDGLHAFPAEADWLGREDPPPLGLRGSASIYGEEASLGYWLFRRPLAWLRRWIGV